MNPLSVPAHHRRACQRAFASACLRRIRSRI